MNKYIIIYHVEHIAKLTEEKPGTIQDKSWPYGFHSQFEEIRFVNKRNE